MIIHNKKFIVPAFIAILISFGAVYFGSLYFGADKYRQDLRKNSRISVWKITARAIVKRPLLGWGQENFLYAFNSLDGDRLKKRETWYDNAHNTFLGITLESGLLGLSVYCFFILAVIKEIWRRRERAILVAILAAYFIRGFFIFDTILDAVFIFMFYSYVSRKSCDN